MMLKKALCLCACILMMQVGKAQKYSLDTLIIMYHAHTKIDTAKYQMLSSITQRYRYKNPQKSLAYADSLVWLAKQMKQPIYLAYAYSDQANMFDQVGQMDEAIKAYNNGLNSLTGKTSRLALQEKARIYNGMGVTLNAANKFDSSFIVLKNCRDIAYQIKDTGLMLYANTNFGVLYMAIADWQTALRYEQEIKSFLEKNDSRLLKVNNDYKNIYLGALLNIGNIQEVLKQYDAALDVELKALEKCKTWKYPNAEAYASGMLSTIYYRKKDYSKDCFYEKFAFDFYNKAKFKQYLTGRYTGFGRLFRDAPDTLLINNNILPEKRYDTVIHLLTKAIQIADEFNSLTSKEDPMEDLSITYERMGNYQKAFEYYKQFKTIHDSLGSQSQQKAILFKDMQSQFGRQTDSLKFEQALQQSHLQQQITANQQQMELANKEKELQHLVFLKTQADLQNVGLENSKNAKELSLTKKEKEVQVLQVNKLANDKHLAAIKLKQQEIIGISIIALIILMAAFILYNNKLRRKRMAAVFAQNTAEQQLKEAELKNRMNDITLSALRSQMNPHFIFNCLNSIMLYTVENKTEAAAAYLNRFAKLIRNMLDSSRSDRITLDSELESIKLYIELEAMRFKNKLQYEINIDNNLDGAFLEIPPLLVQPYIENAIWHGLMPKPEGGKITINISEDAPANLLLIEILDNGVGRQAAETNNQKKQTYHKSLGTRVTGERIALINEKFKSNAYVSITDLYNNNQPAGTQVIIKLPLE